MSTHMRLGLFRGATGSGTIDELVADAAAAERQGFDAYWLTHIFSHDALTGPGDVAIVGSADQVAEQVHALAGLGVTDFAAAEFGTGDEAEATRATLVGRLAR